MPKYRKLYVKAAESLDINEMPDDFTRLLWVILPLGLDREGRGLYHPGWIKSKIMPLRMDVTSERIMGAMEWYQNKGMIEVYEVDQGTYFWIPTWEKYQGDTSRESESNFPSPPSDKTSTDSITSSSCNGHELVMQESCLNAAADSYSNTKAAAEAESGSKSKKPAAPAFLSTSQAQDLLMGITGWSRIPGNMPDSANALGAVVDIIRARGHPGGEEWIKSCFEEFRDRYPRSTKIFWLTDWAVQGVIPPPKKIGEQPKQGVSIEDLEKAGYTVR